MEYKDYYKILGLNKNAGPDQIRKAFRELAKKYHPDKNPGNKSAEEKFKQINEAYEVLKDPEKKKRYDELGESWQSYSANGGRASDFDWNRWTGGQGDFRGGGEFSDFFESLFGGGFRQGRTSRSRAVKGEDLRAVLELELNEVLEGAEKLVQLGGQTIKLKIRPGCYDDQVLRMKGKGSAGYNGGEPGDLLMTIKIKPHPLFKIKGTDLYTDLYVDVFTAVLGGKVTLNTPDKPVSITIPPGTDSGKTLRLKGAGLPQYDAPASRGELYARVLIRVPKSLSKEEKELYRQLQSLRSSENVSRS